MCADLVLFFAIGSWLLNGCGPGPGKTAENSRKRVWSNGFDNTGLPDTARWIYDVGGDGWGCSPTARWTGNMYALKGLVRVSGLRFRV